MVARSKWLFRILYVLNFFILSASLFSTVMFKVFFNEILYCILSQSLNLYTFWIIQYFHE